MWPHRLQRPSTTSVKTTSATEFLSKRGRNMCRPLRIPAREMTSASISMPTMSGRPKKTLWSQTTSPPTGADCASERGMDFSPSRISPSTTASPAPRHFPPSTRRMTAETTTSPRTSFLQTQPTTAARARRFFTILPAPPLPESTTPHSPTRISPLATRMAIWWARMVGPPWATARWVPCRSMPGRLSWPQARTTRRSSNPYRCFNSPTTPRSTSGSISMSRALQQPDRIFFS